MTGRISKRTLRAILLSLQWVCLTIGLGAVVIYADSSLEGLIGSRHIHLTNIFFGAFVLALLLGVSVRSLKLVLPLAALMCFGAAALYVMVLYAPTWDDSTVRTAQLQNFATSRAFFYTGMMIFPALFGAFAGYLLGDFVGDFGEVLEADTGEEELSRPSWWDRRGVSD